MIKKAIAAIVIWYVGTWVLVRLVSAVAAPLLSLISLAAVVTYIAWLYHKDHAD